MLAAAAITLTTLAAKAPEAVFLKARNLVAEATDPVEGLSAAIAAIKGAQESCSADKEADAPLRRVLDQTLAGYERRHSLATVKPQVRRMPARHARHRRRSMAHCFSCTPRVVLRVGRSSCGPPRVGAAPGTLGRGGEGGSGGGGGGGEGSSDDGGGGSGGGGEGRCGGAAPAGRLDEIGDERGERTRSTISRAGCLAAA